MVVVLLMIIGDRERVWCSVVSMVGDDVVKGEGAERKVRKLEVNGNGCRRVKSDLPMELLYESACVWLRDACVWVADLLRRIQG